MISLVDEGLFQLLELDEHYADQELVHRIRVDCKHEQKPIVVAGKPMRNYHLCLHNNKYKNENIISVR